MTHLSTSDLADISAADDAVSTTIPQPTIHFTVFGKLAHYVVGDSSTLISLQGLALDL